MITDNLLKRLSVNSENFKNTSSGVQGLQNMQARLNVFGGPNQQIRMRQDKLRGLKKALLYSYQSAIVQKYDPLTQNVEENAFRCLINHDKLKVDYQDKIISIPFQQIPVGKTEKVQTNFHNGTVFKWVHGNKQEWTPDTYWIVYLQYSEETAYFRGEIRKADQQIQIIVDDGTTHIYRGWMTGPNQTSIFWNVKKGVIWNDFNYTKMLYITKDENTQAFFKRFDRVVIDGKAWEIQAYNDNYGNSSSNTDSGIIRVALKETYTDTNAFIKNVITEQEQSNKEQDDQTIDSTAYIQGPGTLYPFDINTYTIKNLNIEAGAWSVSDPSIAKIIKISQDNLTATIEVITGRSNLKGFDIKYGDLLKHITITPI